MSLRHLRQEHLKGQITICLNESIHIVSKQIQRSQSLCCLQVENGLRDLCWDSSACMLLSPQAYRHYHKHPTKVLLNYAELKIPAQSFTAIVVSLRVVRYCGFSKVYLVSCDYHANGDSDYADCIDYEYRYRRPLFGLQNQVIPLNRELQQIEYEYITPTAECNSSEGAGTNSGETSNVQ